MKKSKKSHAIDIAIVGSAIVHVALIFLFSRAAPSAADCESLQEVSFMDVTYRPEVAKIMKPSAPAGGGGSQEIPDAAAPTYASDVEDVPAIDLSATLDRDPSQAAIDLDGFELDRGEGLDVITLGGEGAGMTTDDILSQPKVALSRGLSREGAGGPGLRGYPGVAQPKAQLQIERAELAKPAARKLPEMSASDLPKAATAPSKGTGFMVAGPISQRKIMNKVVPRYPKWALQRRISGTVVIRLWVMPNGNVKGSPTVETSSGYPDLDQVVVDALKGWRFAALESGVKSENQWGLITFKFTLS